MTFLSHETLLLATDSGALHIYGMSKDTLKLQHTMSSTHDSFITSLLPLPTSATSTSGLSRQWLSTGAATIAICDIRKGIVIQSEDQDDELLSSALIDSDSRVVVGSERGVLRIWHVGVWDDNEVTINLGRQLSAEVIAADRDLFAVGCDNGMIKFFSSHGKRPHFITEASHDDVEGVTQLVWCQRLLISGGGHVLKVWVEEEASDHQSDDPSSDQNTDSDASSDDQPRRKRQKRSKQSNGSMAFQGLD